MRYLVLFAAALAFEAAYTLWSLSVARNRIATAAAMNALIPFLQLLSVVALVEAESWPERLAVAGATGLGYAVATAAVMVFFRRGDAWKPSGNC